jgi:hypothetical protein
MFGSVTHSHWIWMSALLAIWRILIDYWIAPRVLGRELEMHPILAIFALMVGAAVGGFAGVYLALPIAAITRVIWRRLGSSRDQEKHCRSWPLFRVKRPRLDAVRGEQSRIDVQQSRRSARRDIVRKKRRSTN